MVVRERDGEPCAGSEFPLESTQWRSTGQFPLWGQLSRHLGALLGLLPCSGLDSLRWACQHWQTGRWCRSAALPAVTSGQTGGSGSSRERAAESRKKIRGGPLDRSCGVSPPRPSVLLIAAVGSRWSACFVAPRARVDVGFRVCPLLVLSAWQFQ